MLINLIKELSFMGLGGQEKKAGSSEGDFSKWLGQSQAAKSALTQKEEIALVDLLDSLEDSNLVAFLLIHFGGSGALEQEMNHRESHSPQTGLNFKGQFRGSDLFHSHRTGMVEGFKPNLLKRAGSITTKLTGEKTLKSSSVNKVELNAIIKMLKKLSQSQEQIESILRPSISKSESKASDKHIESSKKTVSQRSKAELTLEDGSWRVKRTGRSRSNEAGALVFNKEPGNRSKFSAQPRKSMFPQPSFSEKAQSQQALPGAKGDIPSFGHQRKSLTIGQPIIKKDLPGDAIASKVPISKMVLSSKTKPVQVDSPIKDLNGQREGLLNQKLAILNNRKELAASGQPIRPGGRKPSAEQVSGKTPATNRDGAPRMNVTGQKMSMVLTDKGIKTRPSDVHATGSAGDVKSSDKPKRAERGVKVLSGFSKNEMPKGNAEGKSDQPVLKPEQAKVLQSMVHRDRKIKVDKADNRNSRNKSTERAKTSLKNASVEDRSDKQVPTERTERKGSDLSGTARKGMIESSFRKLGSKVLVSAGTKPSMSVPAGDQTMGHGENLSEEVALQGFKPVSEGRTVMTRMGLEGPQAQSVLRQVADHLSASVRQAPREVVIKLEPEALGKLKVKVTVELEQVSAQVFAENSKVVSLLKGNQGELQQQLKDQGFDLNSFDVRQGFQSDQERSHQSHDKETFWSSEGHNSEFEIDPAAHTAQDRPIHFVSDRGVNVMV